MSVKVKYKGEQILSLNTDTEKALSTMGQYCEDDITIENVQDGGITPSGSITLAEEGSYDVTDKATAVVDMSAKRASIAEVITSKGVDTLPDSDWDTLETNIGLISGGGKKVLTGVLTPETNLTNYEINLDFTPSFFYMVTKSFGGSTGASTWMMSYIDGDSICSASNNSGAGPSTFYNNSNSRITIENNKVVITTISTRPLISAFSYYWVAIE